MSEHEELLARLRKLEDENRRLSARLDELAQPVSRRAMFKRAGQVALGAAALTAGAGMATAPSAAADTGQQMILGHFNSANLGTYLVSAAPNDSALLVNNQVSLDSAEVTGGISGFGRDFGVAGASEVAVGVLGSCPDNPPKLTNSAGVAGIGTRGTTGVLGSSDTGEGVSGHSSGTAGVHGNCQHDDGIGVFGDGSYGATGVYGHSGSGDGVRGVSNEGNAVLGLAFTANGVGVLGVSVERSGVPAPAAAVTGDSKNQNGVQGLSKAARGGVFAGGQAAIRLLPGTLTNTAPANGQDGDFYVDSTGGLWYYRGSWHQLV
jgi:hypothetical protein